MWLNYFQLCSSRSSSYSVEEDKHLCHVYLHISQNPIIGINQKKDQFWARVEMEYNQDPKFKNSERPRRSLQKRMNTIIAAISKLKGCIRQVEETNPNGASEEDIINRAQMLLVQDPNCSKGFKFGHVWSILQGIEKFNSDNDKTASTRVQRQTAQADYS
ncbi:uncharacterized protein LOC141845443 [Curcuma longa]|uniref:uncharacterized protein LOC141845443 n=1 Tax=Curcuma longa TaxID=136217 RepID=UPI003D9F2842